MPKGRFSAFPGLSIHTRRVGLDFSVSLSWLTRVRRAAGDRLFNPSTPAVFLPRLSCVTFLTAMHFADQDLIKVFWSLRTALTSPRLEALKILFWSLKTLTSSFRQGKAFHSTV